MTMTMMEKMILREIAKLCGLLFSFVTLAELGQY